MDYVMNRVQKKIVAGFIYVRILVALGAELRVSLGLGFIAPEGRLLGSKSAIYIVLVLHKLHFDDHTRVIWFLVTTATLRTTSTAPVT
jgi:hypothetical protein